MELPAVGAKPTEAFLVQVVEPFKFTIDQPAGGKVASVNPSVNGKATPVATVTLTGVEAGEIHPFPSV
jgi:hypothetical protein